MSAHDRARTRRGSLRKCSACRRPRDLKPVTIGLSMQMDEPFALRQYVYLCDTCRAALDEQDEMIGPTLEAAVCTMLRAMSSARGRIERR